MYFSNILTHRGNNNLWKFHSIDAIKRILLIVLRNALRRCDRLSRSDSLLRGTITRNNYSWIFDCFKRKKMLVLIFVSRRWKYSI